jgi:hypothetical protein
MTSPIVPYGAMYPSGVQPSPLTSPAEARLVDHFPQASFPYGPAYGGADGISSSTPAPPPPSPSTGPIVLAHLLTVKLSTDNYLF